MSIERMIEDLAKKANESGDAQVLSISSDGWQPITKDGATVGRMRFAVLSVTVEPAKTKKARKSKAKKDAQSGRKKNKL